MANHGEAYPNSTAIKGARPGWQLLFDLRPLAARSGHRSKSVWNPTRTMARAFAPHILAPRTASQSVIQLIDYIDISKIQSSLAAPLLPVENPELSGFARTIAARSCTQGWSTWSCLCLLHTSLARAASTGAASGCQRSWQRSQGARSSQSRSRGKRMLSSWATTSRSASR